MMRFSYRAGLAFIDGLMRWTLLRLTPRGHYQFESDAGEIANLSPSDLALRWGKSEWVIDEHSLGLAAQASYFSIPRDLSTFTAKQQAECERKSRYVKAIKQYLPEGQAEGACRAELLRALEDVAIATNDPSPPALGTVRRWLRRVRATQCVTKLVDGRTRSGRHRNIVQLSLFEEAISEVYFTDQKRSVKRVYDVLRIKVRRANAGIKEGETLLPCPGRATVYRWHKEVHHATAAARRLGKRQASKLLKAALKPLTVTHFLERVEVDHTPVDLIVVCQRTKVVLGRPWLTLAIDRRTRVILGFYLSFAPPSGYSVLHCLCMAILPKDVLLSQCPEVKGTWPFHGIMDSVVADNGMDLHSGDVELVAQDMGVEFQYCPVGEPQMKGAIERMMRTVSEDLFHELPGTTFSNADKRGDYPSEKRAAIDIAILTRLLVKWIVDVYHNTPHRGLDGRTPLEVGTELMAKRVIELPAFPDQLKNIVGYGATRSLFHYGIEIENLRYNSPQLQEIRYRRPETQCLSVKYFEETVEYVNVLDPDSGEYLRAPAVNGAYAAGLSRAVHRLVCAEIRKRYNNAWREEYLIEMRQEMQAMVDQAVHEKRMADRKRGARAKLEDSTRVIDPDARKPLPNTLRTRSKPAISISTGAPDNLPLLSTSKLGELRV